MEGDVRRQKGCVQVEGTTGTQKVYAGTQQVSLGTQGHQHSQSG